MGCGVSQQVPSPEVGFNDHVKLAPNGTGTMPPVLEEVPVSVTEEAKNRPKTGEEGAFELPESEFEDGRLGVTVSMKRPYRKRRTIVLLFSAPLSIPHEAFTPFSLLTLKHLVVPLLRQLCLRQEAEAIENLRNNLAVEEHYCDEDFPADNSSIFFSDRIETGVVWKRPHELHEEAQLFVDGASRRDVVQGALGDCWFLSSCAAVARNPKLIERVVPPDQTLQGENYTGLVVCRFWRFGEWVLVCVDDRLPTKEGEMIFARSSDPREFWVALLEKAYAKLHGSYEALEGGQSMDAMVDLTGGLAERFDMEDTPDKKRLYKLLLRASRHGAFITASRKKDRPWEPLWLSNGDWRMAYKTDEHGLVEGHAYTVSGVASVRHDTMGPVSLVRVRNPWADGAEWNGDWCDSDEKWQGVSDDQRKKLGRTALTDGEFWMGYQDFCDQFEEVSICTIGPDFDQDGTVDQVGQVNAIKGKWVKGENAGGSRNDFEKFATNPQYLLAIEETDVNEDGEGRCSVLVAVMQEHRRSQRNLGVRMLQIGFVLYRTDDPDHRLPSSHFYYNYEEGSSGTYINFREVLSRMELEPGYYVVIPATFQPDIPGHFMVRVYSPKPFSLKKIS